VSDNQSIIIARLNINRQSIYACRIIAQAGETSMRKQPDLTAQTRENLIQAFWSLYRQKKIEHITIKEITTKGGYHRSTFYEYFMDIYDVLCQLEDSLLEYMKEQVLKALEGGLNDDFIQKLADVYESKGDYLGTLLGEKGDPYFAQKLKKVMCPALVAVFGLPENDAHTAYIFEFGMSAILGTVTHWYRSKKDISSKDMVQLLRSMLLSGIYPQIQEYSQRSHSVM
jgi:AcrR family transcriptional regulator